jgi:alpha-glucosidase
MKMGAAIERSTEELRAVGAVSTWVMSNHDVVRHPTRYGGGALGLRRARAALLLILALPGAAFLYLGEELGLEQVDLPDEALRDPIWESSGHTLRGRDGCRVPLPWSGERAPYGFTTGDQTWLPQPVNWAVLSVAAESASATSMLALYREALVARPRTLDLAAPLQLVVTDSVLDITLAGDPGLRCIVNLGEAAIDVPVGEVVLASQPLAAGQLPGDSAVWLRER